MSLVGKHHRRGGTDLSFLIRRKTPGGWAGRERSKTVCQSFYFPGFGPVGFGGFRVLGVGMVCPSKGGGSIDIIACAGNWFPARAGSARRALEVPAPHNWDKKSRLTSTVGRQCAAVKAQIGRRISFARCQCIKTDFGEFDVGISSSHPCVFAEYQSFPTRLCVFPWVGSRTLAGELNASSACCHTWLRANIDAIAIKTAASADDKKTRMAILRLL